MKRKSLSSKGRKRFAAVSIAVLLGAVFVGAFALTIPQPENRIFLGEKTHADSVTVYQNGVTYVTYKENISIGDDETVLQFYLPTGTILETLRIDGIDVLDIRSTGEQPALMMGDKIAVKTSEGEYSGTFRGWNGGGITILQGNKTQMIYNPEEVEVLNPSTPHLGELSINATVIGSRGTHEITVSYLMRGVGWTPSYFLDLDTENLSCWATITGVENWRDVDLKVVSGGPHIVYRPSPYSLKNLLYNGMRMEDSAGFTNHSGSGWSPTDIEEYHEYTLNRKISLYKGETIKIPLLSGKVGLRQEYYWSSSAYWYYPYDIHGKVLNRYYINNTLSEPLPSGIVECYRSGEWVGEDTLKYTGVSDENHITVGYAMDIKVKATTTGTNWEDLGYYNGSYARKYTYSGEIEIKNFKKEDVNVRIEVSTTTDNDMTYSGNPEPEYKNGKLVWTVSVPSGSTQVIDYTYSYIV